MYRDQERRQGRRERSREDSRRDQGLLGDDAKLRTKEVESKRNILRLTGVIREQLSTNSMKSFSTTTPYCAPENLGLDRIVDCSK